MKLDPNKIYTCVNADEIKVGDKVLVANSVRELENRWYQAYVLLYGDCAFTIEEILDKGNEKRFMTEEFDCDDNCIFSLAYLVEKGKKK